MALKSRLMDEIVEVCERKGYSPNTWKTYRYWCEQFLIWLRNENGGRWQRPQDVGRDEVQGWLTWLAVRQRVSPTTQNLAFQAVLFLYREVLGLKIENVDALRSKRPKRLPVVLHPTEVSALFQNLHGTYRLIAQLMYGCGLRVGEALSLRVKDLDLLNGQLMVRQAKGAKDRVIGLPKLIRGKIEGQIEAVRQLHGEDVANQCNRVEVPYSYAKKNPQAPGSLAWYWMFPSHKLSRHPREGWVGRWHVHQSTFTRSFNLAAKRAGIKERKHATTHCLRHSYATHSLNNGIDIRSLQQLMGHNDVRVTMIYTHVDAAGVTSEASPLDRLAAC